MSLLLPWLCALVNGVWLQVCGVWLQVCAHAVYMGCRTCSSFQQASASLRPYTLSLSRRHC